MRTIRIYQGGDFQVGDQVTLLPAAAHHVSLVLRMREGESLRLFSGDNQEFEAKLLSVKKKEVIVELLDVFAINRESSKATHLAQAISKGDKMEWVVQKAVELGVTSISPLITKRCVVKLDEDRMHKKREQWQALAIAACEQSGRNVVPLIHQILPLSRYLEKKGAFTHFVLYPEGKKNWQDYKSILLDPHTDLGLLIGSEGGLDPEEIQLLLNEYDFHPLSLGSRILRTETAAIAALAVLQALSGNL